MATIAKEMQALQKSRSASPHTDNSNSNKRDELSRNYSISICKSLLENKGASEI